MKKNVLFFLLFLFSSFCVEVYANEETVQEETTFENLLKADNFLFLYKDAPGFLDKGPKISFFISEQLDGYVKRKGYFTPRYFYELYDKNDKLVVCAKSRFFTMSYFFSTEMTFDLYDENNEYIGCIAPRFLPNKNGYDFYDKKGRIFANIIVQTGITEKDTEALVFSVNKIDPIDPDKRYDEWGVVFEVKDHYNDRMLGIKQLPNVIEKVDDRFLRVFYSFAFDYQKEFLKYTFAKNKFLIKFSDEKKIYIQ